MSLPFEDNSFDAVTFPQLLHWMGTAAYGGEIDVNADHAALSEISRVMKADGIGLFITASSNGRAASTVRNGNVRIRD